MLDRGGFDVEAVIAVGSGADILKCGSVDEGTLESKKGRLAWGRYKIEYGSNELGRVSGDLAGELGDTDERDRELGINRTAIGGKLGNVALRSRVRIADETSGKVCCGVFGVGAVAG